MTIEAAQLTVIHIALNEVISLHPVFMGGQIGVLIEVCLPRLEFLKLPVISEPLPYQKAHGTVIVFARNGVVERLPLAMALDTGVVPSHEI